MSFEDDFFRSTPPPYRWVGPGRLQQTLVLLAMLLLAATQGVPW
jgi:hypothetical protein